MIRPCPGPSKDWCIFDLAPRHKAAQPKEQLCAQKRPKSSRAGSLPYFCQYRVAAPLKPATTTMSIGKDKFSSLARSYLLPSPGLLLRLSGGWGGYYYVQRTVGASIVSKRCHCMSLSPYYYLLQARQADLYVEKACRHDRPAAAGVHVTQYIGYLHRLARLERFPQAHHW